MADLSGRLVGDYVLREKIGDGGYGEVYRAEHRELRSVAVVKVLKEEQRANGDEEAAARFRREAQLASQLRHPNAAQVYGFGIAAPEGDDDDEVMWIAMQFVDGVTFANWLKTHGPMSLGEAMQFFEPLFKAVDAVHKCGIVHRDLKPANVMVVESKDLDSPGVPIPMLIDFGIAKGAVGNIAEDEPVEAPSGDKKTTGLIRTTRSPLYHRTETSREALPVTPEHRRKITRSGDGFGSRAYMSPEQWDDASKVGKASDIYSLGVMLCEALTGQLPLKVSDTDGHLRVRLPASPAIPLPAELERLLYRAMAVKPEQRQANVLELLADLRTVLKSDPNEQIRALARRWQERGHSRDLLASGATLIDLKRSVQSPRVASKLSKLDDSFLALSLQRARRARWAIGAIVALIALSVFAVRAEVRARTANEYVIKAKVEGGRQALLHGELSEAVDYLEQAYQDGERSAGLKFMLAVGLLPRMSELGRLTSSWGRMWSSVFSADEKQILTADDKNAQVWDAGSHQVLFTMKHGDTVYQAMFSPDHSKILTAAADGTVRLWNAETGAPLLVMTSQRADAKQWRYYSAVMSSHFVAAIDTMGRAVHVWDAETGMQLAELETDASEAASLTLSSDGRWLAASGGDDVRVFDTATWKKVATIAGPRVRSLAFDSTGPRLAVGTYDGNASIWEVPSGARIWCLREAGEPVDAIAFSPDGKLVATGSREGAEQVWDARSGGLRTEFNSHHSKIYAVEFSSTNSLLLSAGADGAVVVSNVATGMPFARLEGPTGFVSAAHFDAEGRRVVGASSDGTARVWDAASMYRNWGTPPIGPECDTEGLEPDGRFIALSCRHHGTRIWDTLRGHLVAELPAVTSAEGDYNSALPAVTAVGDRAAIARGNTVEVYALPSAHLMRIVTHPAAVTAVAFASAGHDLVSGAADGTLLLTRDDRDPVPLPVSASGIDAVALLADGRVVTADASSRLRVFEPDRTTLLMNVVAPFRIRLLRASSDGTRLVTTSVRKQQASPALWDLVQRRLLARLDGHNGRVFGTRFVATGTMLLTAGVDGTARLWDAVSGSLRQTFHGDAHFLGDAVLAPDGSMVVAGGSDGMLRFWDVSDGSLLWTLQAHRSYVMGVHYEGDALVTRGFAGDVARWTLPQPDSVIAACHARSCVATMAPGK